MNNLLDNDSRQVHVKLHVVMNDLLDDDSR